jgi:hypothetical protein
MKFDCLKSHEQFFSYLALSPLPGDRAANLDLCLALMVFSSEGPFYVPHLLQHGTSVFKVISERPVIFTSECRTFGEGGSTTYFKGLGFDATDTSGARTHDLPFAKREYGCKFRPMLSAYSFKH